MVMSRHSNGVMAWSHHSNGMIDGVVTPQQWHDYQVNIGVFMQKNYFIEIDLNRSELEPRHTLC